MFLQFAPLLGLADVHFINTYHKYFGGFNEMMLPYITATINSPIRPTVIKKNLGALNHEITIVPQLLSNDVDGFIHFAKVFFDLGYSKINWNLGCPYLKVTRKNRGSGLLNQPETIKKILDCITPKIENRLSLKVRLGIDSAEDLEKLIPVFNQYNLDEVIIHARVATQYYEGQPMHDDFFKLTQNIDAPVIYNGDIVYREDAEFIRKRAPYLKGLMIGRGAFINPPITCQLNDVPLPANQAMVLFESMYWDIHHYFRQRAGGTTGSLSKLKEMWAYFHQNLSGGKEFYQNLLQVTEPLKFDKAVQAYWNSHPTFIRS